MKCFAPTLAFAALCAPLTLIAATLQPIYLDAAGIGFNDATLGTARRATLNSALTIWGNQLRSNQVIKVAVSFDSLPCASGAATLGAGEPISYLQNFVGAPVPNRLYPAALAEALSRLDLNAGGNEIVLRMNANVDQGCAGSITGFDYNTNPSTATAPNNIRALPVMLHELAHGLGFFTPICLVNIPGGCSSSPGQWPYGGYPNNVLDRWADFLRDGPGGNFWNALSSSQRIASARSGNLVWDGPRVTAALPALNLNAAATLGGRIKMHAPPVLSANASVNHYTIDATPNLLMEPDYSQLSNISGLDLAPALLADLGWQLSTDPIPTSTVITSDDPDPSLVNASYTVNVAVSSLDGLPTGTVTIRDGIEANAASCTASIQASGQASCVLSSTIAGTRTLNATYAGGGAFQVSSDTEEHFVSPSQIDLSLSAILQRCSLRSTPILRQIITVSKAGNYSGTEPVRVEIPYFNSNGEGPPTMVANELWSCQVQSRPTGLFLICSSTYANIPSNLVIQQDSPVAYFPARRLAALFRDVSLSGVVGAFPDSVPYSWTDIAESTAYPLGNFGAEPLFCP